MVIAVGAGHDKRIDDLGLMTQLTQPWPCAKRPMEMNFSPPRSCNTPLFPDDDSASVTDAFRFNDTRVTSLRVTPRYVTLRHNSRNTRGDQQGDFCDRWRLVVNNGPKLAASFLDGNFRDKVFTHTDYFHVYRARKELDRFSIFPFREPRFSPRCTFSWVSNGGFYEVKVPNQRNRLHDTIALTIRVIIRNDYNDHSSNNSPRERASDKGSLRTVRHRFRIFSTADL